MMINYLGSPGRLTLHDDLNYDRTTKLPDARLDETKDSHQSVQAPKRDRVYFSFRLGRGRNWNFCIL